ncbi:unnamed protein product [Ostreobium quekettii]|uniref:BTB domain-containing protein n=1 Tax=Ostreobium quekettii TaxID=121088 RepID=A0A8S1IJM8_9CHLO|nr:unnamed protein product [Ostreobium quekettii]
MQESSHLQGVHNTNMSSEHAVTYSYLPQDVDGYEDMCDACLVLAGRKFPVHTAVLAVHSRFFRKMIVDLRSDISSSTYGQLEIPVAEAVSAEDIELMLAFVYGQHPEVETAEEASRMLCMADRFDIPGLLEKSERKIKDLEHKIYFLDQGCTGDGVQSEEADPWLSAAHWLGIADRLGIDDLRTKCQRIVLRDLLANGVLQGTRPDLAKPGLEKALSSLDSHRVTARAMAEIIVANIGGMLHGEFEDVCMVSCTACGAVHDCSKMSMYEYERDPYRSLETYKCRACGRRTRVVGGKSFKMVAADDGLAESLQRIRIHEMGE